MSTSITFDTIPAATSITIERIDKDSVTVVDFDGRTFVLKVGHELIVTANQPPRYATDEQIRRLLREVLSEEGR